MASESDNGLVRIVLDNNTVDVSQVQQYGVLTLTLVNPDNETAIPVPGEEAGVSGGLTIVFAGGQNVKPAFYRFLDPQVQQVPTGAVVTVTGPNTYEDGRQYLSFSWPGGSDPAIGTQIPQEETDAKLKALMSEAGFPSEEEILASAAK